MTSARPRRLQPVPNVPPRAVIYTRVSQVGARGDDLTSPELQEQAARDYCTRRGYTPVTVLVDLDRSGRSWSRRQVEAAVQMIEAGDADVIVCWRWSRFTRNLRDYVIQTARIEAAGGRLEAALEETDPATAAGLMQRDLFAVLAAWESRRTGEQWRETQARRRREGLGHTNYPRLGYRLADKAYVVEPAEAGLLVEAYRRYVSGDGGKQLADWLNRLGVVQPRSGGVWSPKTVLRMLDSGFGAGLLRVGDSYIEASHPAVVDERLWRAFVRERERRREVPARLVGAVHPLSGLVRCPECKRAMRLKRPKRRWVHGVKTDRPGSAMFRCESYGCPAPVSVSAARAVAEVLAWLRPIVDEVEVSATVLAADRASRVVARADVKELRRQVNRLEARKTRLTVDLSSGLVLPADYRSARDALSEAQREVLRALREAEAAVGRPAPSRRVVKRLLDHWGELDDVARRRAVGELVARVDVVPVAGERALIRPWGTWEV